MRKRLHKLHPAEKRQFEKKHPRLTLALADAVRVRNLPGESRLDRLWQGPCEVLQVVSYARFQVYTPDGVQTLRALRLKPYLAPTGCR